MTASNEHELRFEHLEDTECKAEDFYVSQWSDKKAYFLVYRIIIFVYWTTWVLIGVVEYLHLNEEVAYVAYLTHWGEWTLVLNFAVSLFLVIYGYKKGRTGPLMENLYSTGHLRWFHHLSWTLKTISAPLAFTITILFWTLIRSSKSSVVVDIHRHILNSVFAIIDLWMSKVPTRLLHVFYPIIFGIFYIIYTVLIYGLGITTYIYPNALDWSTIPFKTGITSLLVIFILVPVFHLISYGICWLRSHLARRFQFRRLKYTAIEGHNIVSRENVQDILP